jgi:hypothetical protein
MQTTGGLHAFEMGEQHWIGSLPSQSNRDFSHARLLSLSPWSVVWHDDERFWRALLNVRSRLDLQAHGVTPIFYAARRQRLGSWSLPSEADAHPIIAAPDRTALGPIHGGPCTSI